MAYIIDNRPPVSIDNPLGIKLEFTASKLFSSTYTTDEQVSANIKNLLLTLRGERRYLPTFGTDLLRLIFEPNTEQLVEAIQTTILNAIAKWLPYVQVTDIDVTSGRDIKGQEHDMLVTITYVVLPTKTEQKIKIFSDENGSFIVEEA